MASCLAPKIPDRSGLKSWSGEGRCVMLLGATHLTLTVPVYRRTVRAAKVNRG